MSEQGALQLRPGLSVGGGEHSSPVFQRQREHDPLLVPAGERATHQFRDLPEVVCFAKQSRAGFGSRYAVGTQQDLRKPTAPTQLDAVTCKFLALANAANVYKRAGSSSRSTTTYKAVRQTSASSGAHSGRRVGGLCSARAAASVAAPLLIAVSGGGWPLRSVAISSR